MVRDPYAPVVWEGWHRGVSPYPDQCRDPGFWRMSGHPAVQHALRHRYFQPLGLPRLHVIDRP
jgi:hypothetical protein